MAPPFQTLPNGNILSVCGRVVALSCRQSLTIVLNRMPITTLSPLLKDTPNTVVASITYNTCCQLSIKRFQDRCRRQQFFQQVECIGLLLAPNKINIFSGKHSQWACNFTKAKYKTSIIITKAKELLHMGDILWHRPLLNYIYFSRFKTNSLSWNNMTQKNYFFKKKTTLFLF